MTLSFQVLGDPGRDNALLVKVDTGQAVSRLLLDCGEGCLSGLPFAEVREIDHLFFSHLHMDHVAGFDAFFRCTFNRTDRPNHVWGPPRTGHILHHRFQGFLWNLVGGQQATWQVHDLHPGRIETHRFELAEAFAQAHDGEERSWDRTIVEGPGYSVEALLMDHGTPSAAYVVREAPRVNVDPARLTDLGLRPGPWLQRVRGPRADDAETIDVGGFPRRVRELQESLLTVTPGDSVAYLTDFLLDDAAADRLSEALKGVGSVVCESQYRDADLELARRNYHMTAVQAASLAARAVFPATAFPEHWAVEGWVGGS